jgi:hypothetical protein
LLWFRMNPASFRARDCCETGLTERPKGRAS